MTRSAVLLAVLCAGALPAQQPSTASVTVRTRSEGKAVDGASVRSGRVAGLTDSAGTARLLVPPGERVILVQKVGYRPDTVLVDARVDSARVLEVDLEVAELEAITVVSARGERRLEDEPLRVEVLAAEDIEEKTAMRPGDVTHMLVEMAGVKPQATAPALGGTRFRVQGLRGQYTAVMADGLPLYGGATGDFGLLQLAPLDVKQIEVIKGSATALYGPTAMGGVINFVSRRPDDTREIVVNQTSRGGSDILFWDGDRINDRWGYSLVADVHRQQERDVTRDGFADFPGFTRGAIRPRLYFDDSRGNRLFATAGVMREDRTGGAVAVGSAAREALATTRSDIGISGERRTAGRGRLAFKASGVRTTTGHDYGARRERDVRSTLFAEGSWSGARGNSSFVAGAVAQRDALTARDVPAFSDVFTAPAAFAQHSWSPRSWVSTQTSVRCDAHSAVGTVCSPRASVITRFGAGVTVRTSIGTGFFAPTPITEETAPIGLAPLTRTTLGAERAQTASIDATGSLAGWELSGTLARSRVKDPVGLVATPTPRLRNIAGTTVMDAAEFFAVYNAAPWIITAFYAYVAGEEPEFDGGRRPAALVPRHAAGLDLMYEIPSSGTRLAIEGFYTGRQALADTPGETESRPYTLVGALVMQRIGRAQLFLNIENALNTRQTDFLPIWRATPGLGGRRVNDQWGPLEGRVVNAGVRWRL